MSTRLTHKPRFQSPTVNLLMAFIGVLTTVVALFLPDAAWGYFAVAGLTMFVTSFISEANR